MAKMMRDIISIDEEKCNGCGLCITSCAEGALRLVNGKAKLISDSFCDGLGACMPACPTDAIRIIKREAEDFDEEAVAKRMEQKKQPVHAHGGCPSMMNKVFERPAAPAPVREQAPTGAPPRSQLRQWPVQIKLINPQAPFLNGAKLLIAADCTAYAYGDMHSLMKGRVTLIGCPKLDEGDYSEKLTQMLLHSDIQSVTVVRMEVPCCGGIVSAVKTALAACGKQIPWSVVTISTDGEIIGRL